MRTGQTLNVIASGTGKSIFWNKRMNERIRELAEQAWIETKEEFDSIVDDGGSINFTFAHAYDQKFAELIVRECASIADSADPLQDGSIGIIIKEHLGVEE
jgi:KaiC/GvpD/RAD55 family RecA-like ATPase